MEQKVLLEIFTSAPILFFILGLIARAVRSDLEIPKSVSKFLSIFVLLAIGLKGGVKLSQAEALSQCVHVLLFATLGSFAMAFAGYHLFKKFLSHSNATALAASYGSISAITFVTGVTLLERLGIPYGPYMVAAMALMESPAILMAIYLHKKQSLAGSGSFWSTVHHAFANSSVILLMGGFCVGMLLSPASWSSIAPFYDQLFYGILTLFLLDLGLLAASHFEGMRLVPARVYMVALALPISAALITFLLGQFFHLPMGDTLLLMLLFGSASYIAAPAAIRVAVPDANPSIYLSLAMGVTFSFNMLIGIPLYFWLVSYLGTL